MLTWDNMENNWSLKGKGNDNVRSAEEVFRGSEMEFSVPGGSCAVETKDKRHADAIFFVLRVRDRMGS